MKVETAALRCWLEAAFGLSIRKFWQWSLVFIAFYTLATLGFFSSLLLGGFFVMAILGFAITAYSTLVAAHADARIPAEDLQGALISTELPQYVVRVFLIAVKSRWDIFAMGGLLSLAVALGLIRGGSLTIPAVTRPGEYIFFFGFGFFTLIVFDMVVWNTP